MQNSQLPAKWLKPFAADDAAKVEIPLTTSEAARASQSLGFPPLTMQPPESGGVPPQGEDFNGAMNQVARIVWWRDLAGGAIPFDNTWATNAAIGGYPQGAAIAAADLQGEWISTVDNNVVDPDTTGTGWVPGYAYGATSVAMTGSNVTLTPAQAAKPIIVITGALSANVQLIFPAWSRTWLVVNNTTGNFTITAKTAAGSGVVLPLQSSQAVWGDGTNLLISGYAAAQVAGVVGASRGLKSSLATAGNSVTFTADEVIVETALGGVRYCVPNVNKTINLATTGAGGMDTGTAPTGFVGVYLIYNPATGVSALLGVNGSAAALPEVYGGANMPAGYIASALLSCLRTNAGVGFQVFAQTDRAISVATVLEQSTTTPIATPSAFTATSLSRNAKTVSGLVTYTCSVAAGGGTSVFGFSAGVGAQGINFTVVAGGTASVSFSCVPVVAPPTLYYTGTTSAGTGTYQVSVSGYSI